MIFSPVRGDKYAALTGLEFIGERVFYKTMPLALLLETGALRWPLFGGTLNGTLEFPVKVTDT